MNANVRKGYTHYMYVFAHDIEYKRMVWVADLKRACKSIVLYCAYD
jgi:hypothetical protein